MQSFLNALEQFGKINPDNAFDQLFRLLHSINTMDKPTVIAAHQTLTAFRHSLDLEFNDERIAPLRRALIHRMIAVYHETPPNKRDGLAETFFWATGQEARPILFEKR